MVINSYTETGKSYNVVMSQSAQAVACDCKGFHYTKKACRHMNVASQIVQEEAGRAATFLKLKAKYDYRSVSVREARRAAYVAQYDPCLIG